MTTFMKNGIEICMPEDDEKSRQNMIIAADGKKVLAKIEEKERLEAIEKSADIDAE